MVRSAQAPQITANHEIKVCATDNVNAVTMLTCDKIARTVRGAFEGHARRVGRRNHQPPDQLAVVVSRHRLGDRSDRRPGNWSDQREHPAPFRAPRILLVVIGRRSASASASPSRGPGNGILRAETGGRFQAQNAGERPDFGSQTANCLTNRPELRGFLPTRKPRRFAGTAWWWTQSCRTRLQQPNSLLAGKITGNSSNFALFVTKCTSERFAPSVRYAQIPYELEQGIHFRRTGNLICRTGNSVRPNSEGLDSVRNAASRRPFFGRPGWFVHHACVFPF